MQRSHHDGYSGPNEQYDADLGRKLEGGHVDRAVQIEQRARGSIAPPMQERSDAHDDPRGEKD